MNAPVIEKKYEFGMGEDCCLKKYTCGEQIWMHSHDFYEMLFVSEGGGCCQTGGLHYPVSKGSLFLIPPGTVHCVYNDAPGAGELVVYKCMFSANVMEKVAASDRGLAKFLSPCGGKSLFLLPVKAGGAYAQKIHTAYKDMLVEYTAKHPGWEDMLRQYIIQVFILIYRLYLDGAAEDTKHFDCGESLAYINDHYNADIHLEELAELVKMSPNYFCRKFKESTGMGVSEYIQKIRVEKACQMLKGENRKVIDVMMDVGYCDAKNFTAIFKKHTGMTPSQYKKLVS